MFLGVLPCGKNDGEVRLRLAATHQGQNPQKPTTFDFPSHLLYEASGPLPGRHVLVHCGVNFDRTYWDFV